MPLSEFPLSLSTLGDLPGQFVKRVLHAFPSSDVVRVLLEAGAKTERRDRSGSTALSYSQVRCLLGVPAVVPPRFLHIFPRARVCVCVCLYSVKGYVNAVRLLPMPGFPVQLLGHFRCVALLQHAAAATATVPADARPVTGQTPAKPPSSAVSSPSAPKPAPPTAVARTTTATPAWGEVVVDPFARPAMTSTPARPGTKPTTVEVGSVVGNTAC